MSSPPASAALVTALRWRSERSGIHSTIVGKLTMQLREDGRAALIAPEPFISFDLLAPETQRVLEASELMPWTATRSFVAYGGPLRFVLFSAGRPALSIALGAEAPVGISMASDERVAYARTLPSRGDDGVLTIPDDIDGRYFVSAPATQHFASLVGDETFTLELAGFGVRRALPGLAVVVSVAIGREQRLVALTTDFLSVSARERRISLVARAVVRGEAAVLRHSLVPIGSLGSADFGDLPPALAVPPRSRDFEDPPTATALLDMRELERLSLGEGDETTDVSPDELAALAAPYALEHEPPSGRQAPLPATPFDPGFVPVPVLPGAGVLATLTPDEEMARQLDEMRRALRAEGPAPGAVRTADKTVAEAPQTTRVAPPKPGAMAKPRFKRR